MSRATQAEINLDTSVIINYVFSNLPGDLEEDRGCQRLIDEDSFYTVIGGKAEGELDALCDRRYDLYNDVVEFLLSTDNEIFDYDPVERDVHTSPNDERHFRSDIQMNWYDKPKREQLDTLRRCFQELEVYQIRIPEELIDECFPQQTNADLLDRFENELGVGHDCEILVDAAEISHQHSIDVLVAVDSDITDEGHVDIICDIIEDVLGVPDLLRISEPDGV
ncbi:hypothetical protein [Natronomonas amylolytica]|uniref:hypothetical protein n=1 Tax=Natronomonas amylolytica TaxID=3108498 RepID=UPI00300962D0